MKTGIPYPRAAAAALLLASAAALAAPPAMPAAPLTADAQRIAQASLVARLHRSDTLAAERAAC